MKCVVERGTNDGLVVFLLDREEIIVHKWLIHDFETTTADGLNESWTIFPNKVADIPFSPGFFEDEEQRRRRCQRKDH